MSMRTFSAITLAVFTGVACTSSGGSGPASAGSGGATASGTSSGDGGSGAGGPATGAGATGSSTSASTTSASSATSTTGSGGGVVSYATDFDLTESPISESAAWRHDGFDWTVIATMGGAAYGTQAIGPRPESQHYNDSYAYLTGFPSDQRATATIQMASNMDGACTHEVELLLRWADSAHEARGYECNIAWNGAYAQIVRWNGPYGDYTPLADAGVVSAGVHDGDELSADVVGGHITVRLNGNVIVSVDDPVWTDGGPGVGLYRGVSGCGSLGDYGFTRYTASSIP